MLLVEDVKGNTSNYLIITGEGKTELLIMRGLTHVYNGHHIKLDFPFTARPRETGLTALNSIKYFLKKYNSIIYLVDGDVFDRSPSESIKEYLQKIGIKIEETYSYEEIFVIKIELGGHRAEIYCVISGQVFIEEEIASLINIKFGNNIDLSGEKDSEWKKRIKSEVNRVLKENRMKLDALLRNTGKKKLEIAFPHLCAILKKIEEDYNS